MADVLWLSLALPLFAGTGLSFLVERLLQPGTLPVWKRQPATLMIHTGIWVLLFAFGLAVLRRPWFTSAIELAFLLFVVQIGNAKFHSLREPFIFQDFIYFTHALQYPRLYLPFLGVGRALLAGAVFGAALFAGLALESTLTGRVPAGDFIMMLSVLALGGLALLWLGTRKKLTVIFDPATDVHQLGLLASLWRYGEEEQGYHNVTSRYDVVEPVRVTCEALPTLVVVQSESFFDARRLFSGIRTEVLKEFDTLKASAVCQGQVEVSAWGANTVRTEFAFLSGLETRSLGVHRFNPYRKLARQGIPTLAGFLKRLGYRTVCVHPFHAGFYARNKVFPQLGFDEFIDIDRFDGVEKTGPYIGDVVLAEKVRAVLEAASTQPAFVFVITMENHGPLHLEKALEGEEERLYSSAPPDGCEDLTMYLRHLNNADRMAGMLRDQLEAMPGAGWLCWFGDHVPIMPNVYKTLSTPDGRTDYVIWQKGDNTGEGALMDLKIEDLGYLLLRKMGLIS